MFLVNLSCSYLLIFPLQLLGYIDLDTREWHDGVLTVSSRQVIKEPEGS